MKIISWNVNGLRSLLKKNNLFNNSVGNFENFIQKYDPDILCLQEIKMSCKADEVFNSILQDYPYKYWSHCSGAPGRHGVAIFSKLKPNAVITTLGTIFTGRYLCLEFSQFYLVNVYAQNAGQGTLKNLGLRNHWDDILYNNISTLKKKKEVVVLGDFNVVELEMDTYNFEKQRNKVAGVTDLERDNFKRLLNSGMYNAFREFYPNKVKYTYYSYFRNSRKFNRGMTLDYFLVTPRLMDNRVYDVKVLDNIYGSDHLPIEMELV
jgi:exodeoxyribonuclease-3